MSRFNLNDSKNHLYYGDNLEVLRKYVPDESVDLCYIDPPFNSKRNYNQIYTNVGKEDTAQAQAFVDTWNWDNLAIQGFREIVENRSGLMTNQTINLILGLEKVLGQGSLLAYLVSMTLRVTEIHRVLKSTGSFYFHCDPTSSHYLKLVIDSVFCAQGGDFQNEITWRRTNAHNDAKRRFGSTSDIIFFYSKSRSHRFTPQYVPHEENYVKNFYRYQDSNGRVFRLGDMTSPSPRPNMMYEWKGFPSPLNGWRYSKEKMTELDKQGRIWYPDSQEKRPYLKRYLDEMSGIPISDIWDDIQPLSSQAKERLGYPTQKPESLLERIIQASSNDGDVILDAYCGCGTTVAVAQKLNRRWIGVDITYQSVSLILKRLEDTHGASVLDEVVISGLPKDIASATALANRKDDRTRKEFEKWAVLTYSKNRAAIQERKGADRGIDGSAFFPIDDKQFGQVLFQVKSGAVGPKDIRDLVGTMTREKADLGVFITLREPTKSMLQEAKTAGTYHHGLFNREVPRVKVVTIAQILDGTARLDVPMVADVLKSSTRRRRTEDEQISLRLA